MFVGGRGRSVCHLSLGSEDGIICFPEVRLFLHLVSLGTTPGGLHKKELANRRIVRDTSLASVAFERPAAMVCMPSSCMSPSITHADQDKTQERSCSCSAEVALLGGLMTHAIRGARCIPPLLLLHLGGICKSSINPKRAVSCKVLLHSR